MPTRYLYTSDREDFIELDHVVFEPASRSGRWIVCSSLVPLPSGVNPLLFTSAGQMHFLMVERIATSMVAGAGSSHGCRAVITETAKFEPDEIQQIHDIFREFDLGGGSKQLIYKRPKPADSKSDIDTKATPENA